MWQTHRITNRHRDLWTQPAGLFYCYWCLTDFLLKICGHFSGFSPSCPERSVTAVILLWPGCLPCGATFRSQPIFAAGAVGIMKFIIPSLDLELFSPAMLPFGHPEGGTRCSGLTRGCSRSCTLGGNTLLTERRPLHMVWKLAGTQLFFLLLIIKGRIAELKKNYKE